MRRRIGVLASVLLAAVITVVPRTTAAGTRVYTDAAVGGSLTTRHASLGFSPLDPFANHPTTTVVAADPDERLFENRASRGGARSTTTSTTAEPPTTSTTVEPTTTTEAPTTSTTVRPRPTTTTTEAPRPPPEATADTTDAYQPPEGCMVHGEKSYDEMVRCWDSLVRRWSWPSVSKVFHVMYCESKGDPYAGASHPYHGLMQIGPDGPFDPYENMVEAWRKSSGGTDWSPWSCS